MIRRAARNGAERPPTHGLRRRLVASYAKLRRRLPWWRRG
jgi:hypothetical protein